MEGAGRDPLHWIRFLVPVTLKLVAWIDTTGSAPYSRWMIPAYWDGTNTQMREQGVSIVARGTMVDPIGAFDILR